MDADFMKLWLSGFFEGYKQLDVPSAQKLMRSCAIHCADSHPIHLYREAKAQSDDSLLSFFRALGSCEAIQTDELLQDHVYHILYPTCYCDLHTDFFVNDRNLCECSRQCIIYCLQSVLPDTHFSVRTIHTILEGANSCCFEITFS